METAIRWSPFSTADQQRFLIADVAGNNLQFCEIVARSGNRLDYRTIHEVSKLPNFTAFDWSRHDESVVAIGTSGGEARVVRVDSRESGPEFTHVFPVKLQRKCNSIAFNRFGLLASGLDRARNDSSLNIYDTRVQISSSMQMEPNRKLSLSEVVSNVKFFNDQPDVLLAGIARQGIRLYDLRDTSTIGTASASTRSVHFLSIDPLDENYFASVGPGGDNVVHVWDRRVIARSSAAAMADQAASSAVLEIRSVVDPSPNTGIWSLRYSGIKRGVFSVLSSSGQLRVFEMSQFPQSDNTKINSSGLLDGDLDHTHFIRKSTDLEHQWNHPSHGRDESLRATAFDWVLPGSMMDEPCIISIRKDRSLELIPTETSSVFARITAANDFNIPAAVPFCLSVPKTASNIADELQALRSSALLNVREETGNESKPLSSYEQHAKLLTSLSANSKQDFADVLKVTSTAKRRCEEGYLFNCQRNRDIVKNDPWLMEFWDTIGRFENMAADDGMVHDSIDLSYLGVRNILASDLGPNPTRNPAGKSVDESQFGAIAKAVFLQRNMPEMPNISTRLPHQRQLGLLLCDWRFSEAGLVQKCNELVHNGQHYEAVATAVCHDRKDIGIDLLRNLTRTKTITNSGLAAVIACDTVSLDQRALCEWMAEDADDPYLRALLLYFVTASWDSIVGMATLSLKFRVAVALKYLPDDHLADFLVSTTADAIARGDLEGIVLTGLAESSMDLLQNYFANFSDLQTTVLAAAFTNPLYVSDPRWPTWKSAYLDTMQTWHTLMERTRFNVQHNRRATTRDGTRLIPAPLRQVTLRCNHCQGPLARHAPGKAANSNAVSGSKTPAGAAGTICPRCGRHMPRCAICMMWLGTPDASRPRMVAGRRNSSMSTTLDQRRSIAEGTTVAGNRSLAAAATAPAVGIGKTSTATAARAFASLGGSSAIGHLPVGDGLDGQAEDAELLSRFINFCMSCNHGSHAHHARDWFARHQMCPVPECRCLCSLR